MLKETKKPKKRLAVSKKRIYALMAGSGACLKSYARVDKMLKDPKKYIRLYNRYWFTAHTFNLTMRHHVSTIGADLAFIGIHLCGDSMPLRRLKLSLTYINSELKRLCAGHGI